MVLAPCVIVRGFGASACLVAPLTTSKRTHKMRVDVGIIDGRVARANISQIRVIDTKRLVEKVGFLDKNVFVKLRKSIRDLF